jgi:hypothetical protein
MGEQPMQQRFDQSRGMLIGTGIAGAQKNQGHPRERQQPVFNERTRFRHRDKEQVCRSQRKENFPSVMTLDWVAKSSTFPGSIKFSRSHVQSRVAEEFFYSVAKPE